MKHIFKSVIVLTVIAASFVTFSAFETKTTKVADSYVISLMSKETVGGNTTWSWSLHNPNPGNGNNGTLQNVSHWSVPLNAASEAALVSAQYSYDGVNWNQVSTSVERDPSIRLCTTVDVLKYDQGTTGTAPTYFRATFSSDFVVNPYATSWIKTGGGLQGCNMYFFSGMGAAVN